MGEGAAEYLTLWVAWSPGRVLGWWALERRWVRTISHPVPNLPRTTPPFFFLSLFLVFLGPCLWHMEVPRLGVELELQLLTYTTAAAMLDP